jgi:hypothetical protein
MTSQLHQIRGAFSPENASALRAALYLLPSLLLFLLRPARS